MCGCCVRFKRLTIKSNVLRTFEWDWSKLSWQQVKQPEREKEIESISGRKINLEPEKLKQGLKCLQQKVFNKSKYLIVIALWRCPTSHQSSLKMCSTVLTPNSLKANFPSYHFHKYLIYSFKSIGLLIYCIIYVQKVYNRNHITIIWKPKTIWLFKIQVSCIMLPQIWWGKLHFCYAFSILNCFPLFLCLARCRGLLGFTGQIVMSMGLSRESKSIKKSCFTNFPNKTINDRHFVLTFQMWDFK